MRYTFLMPWRALALVLVTTALAPGYALARENATEADPQEAGENEARLTRVEGSVYLQLSEHNEGEFIEAKQDAVLGNGDHVRTGTDGRAEISFEGESVIELGPNSDFVINSLHPKRTEFHLGIGHLVAKLRSLALGRRLEFHTNAAVLAVRGTELAVAQTSDAEPTVVGVFDEGSVSVQSKSGGEPVLIEAGQETEVRHGRPPAAARSMQMMVRHRTRLVFMRKRLDIVRKAWKPRALMQRRELRRRLVEQGVLRPPQLKNMRDEMRPRSYQHLRQRQENLRQERGASRQQIRERRQELRQRRQERRQERRQQLREQREPRQPRDQKRQRRRGPPPGGEPKPPPPPQP